MRKLFSFMAVVLLLAGALPWSATAHQADTLKPAAEFKPGDILIRFKEGTTARAADSLRAQVGATFQRNLYLSPVELWQVAEGQELAVIEQLNAHPAVEYAEPNWRYQAFEGAVTPNDTGYGNQWAHPKIGSPAAWDVATGSNTIVIAIIDSGIDTGHPDLASKLVPGYDFVDNDSNPTDLNGHGTHVAGIAAAVTNNSVGVAGMSWGAKIMPVRVLDANGSGWSSDITDGISWARSNGAHILNLSLGGTTYESTMQDAVNAAHGTGKLVVAAMGNCRTAGGSCATANPTMYPAAYANVMAVAATTTSDAYAYYSQYGAHCDIAAPGGEMGYLHDPAGIYSTMPTYDVFLTTTYGYYKNYDRLQGTSQATPYVSGLAALIWTVAPTFTPDQVQSRIETTAVDLGTAGWDTTYGHGRINAAAALAGLATPETPTLNPITNPSNADNYTVSWTIATGATGYLLQEDINGSFTTPITRFMGTDTSYSVTGQPAGTFYYRVRAYNAWGNSTWSGTQSTTVAAHGYSPPTLYAISNSDSDGNYLVDWSDVAGATSYTLEESTNPYFSSPSVVYNGPASQLTVTDHPGGTWYYRVRAFGPSGNSAWSLPQSTGIYSDVFLPLVVKNWTASGGSVAVLNGDFEMGATVWNEYSAQGWPLVVNDFSPTAVTAHSGSWAAWLGGDIDEVSEIYQTLVVPSSYPYLVYWRWIASEDACGFDYGRVIVNSTTVNEYSLCASVNTGGWSKHVVNLGAYAGQSVSLKFQATTDGSLNSNLFVDDVAFQSGATSSATLTARQPLRETAFKSVK